MSDKHLFDDKNEYYKFGLLGLLHEIIELHTDQKHISWDYGKTYRGRILLFALIPQEQKLYVTQS